MIPIFEPYYTDRERSYLLECIDTGWISSQGTFIERFENAFAARISMPFGVATSSCTTALHLALDGLEIGGGDEVICPDLTFIAPANMIRLTGAKLVLADVDPTSWAIDPAAVEAAITQRTRAILVVHPFGHVADMDAIMSLAEKHDLRVIEDVAEAPDATLNGKVAGTFGDAACYSFFANKIMTTGEGGMIVCNDAALNKRFRILRDHGMSREKRYVHTHPGYNYRMTNMQAAVGIAQLEVLDEIHEIRNKQCGRYANWFGQSKKTQFRPTAPSCTPVHWMTTITLEDADLRPRLMAFLSSEGIDSRQMIFPVHDAAHFQEEFGQSSFPVATDISYRSLHLPSGTGLQDHEIDHIAETTLDWLEKNG